jgi:hypothetical protein
MKRSRFLVLVCLGAAGSMFGQPSSAQAPIADNPKVELKGKIERIRITRGQGMPSLEVKTGDKTVSVVLGSMRYLLEQDFNPKAGEVVVVTGYRVDESVVAISVTLPATGKILRLRDEAGRPVWMGGRRGPR